MGKERDGGRKTRKETGREIVEERAGGRRESQRDRGERSETQEG